jgi:hypothetical protein
MHETASPVEAVVRAVRKHGAELRLSPSTAEFTIDGVTLERPWVYRTWEARRADRAQRAFPEDTLAFPEDTLVLTDRMTKADAAEAKLRGVWFADAAGRMYVRAPGVLVDIGELVAARAPTDRPGKAARQATNLMSPGRAQVVFCLLAWPRMTQAPVRALARTAGVSVGLAQQVLTALAADKFLTMGNERLLRVDELLDQWTAAFGLGLARRLELGRFVGEPTAQAWADAGHVVYLGGEAAVPDELRGGGELTLYVPVMDTRAVIAAGWRRADPQTAANIVVRKQFWTEPDLLEGLETIGEVRGAPLPLVYADLVASGEPRQREVARHLREQVVGLHSR